MNIYTPILEYGNFTRKCSNEYSSPCPKNGLGEDRFVLIIENDGKIRWFCRGECRDCGKQAKNGMRYGDDIDYLRLFSGKSFQEACEIVGRKPVLKKEVNPQQHYSLCPTLADMRPKTVFQNEQYPSEDWIRATNAVVRHFHSNLLMNNEGLSYAKERGLTVETCKRFQIGWAERDCYPPANKWGFPDELNENGNPKKLFIPKGLVIPTFRGDRVVSATVRRPGWTKDSPFPKYYQFRTNGDGDLFFVAGGKGPVVLVEGILDAILLYQHTNGAFTGVAENGATKTPSIEVMNFLKNAPIVFLSHDNDESGRKAIERWLRYDGLNAFPFRVPVGKDLGEFIQAGGNVQDWLDEGMTKYS